MDYQAAKDLISLGLRVDALEQRMDTMGQLTEAAIGQLTDAVAEVEQEITALKNDVEAGNATDADVANRLGGLSTRLRNASPDTPVVTEPTEPVTEPTDGTATTDNTDNA